jgi:F0F1-type ATP synthase membrane subunit b/b'
MITLAFAGIQLFPDGTLFIHIALILIMIWLLNRTFFKPINEVLERRSRQKVGRGGEAEDILREVAEKQKQYEKAMLDARSESYEMIESERTAAVDLRQKTISDARQAAAESVLREKARLRDEVADVKVQIALEAERMADKITSNILKA